MFDCHNIKNGVVFLIGDDAQSHMIANVAYCVNLYIQYGNNAIKPIQLQIDKERWEQNSDIDYYIEELKAHEPTAKLFDSDKNLI